MSAARSIRPIFRLGYPGLIAGAVVADLPAEYPVPRANRSCRNARLSLCRSFKSSTLRSIHESQQLEYRIAEANRLDVIEARATAMGMRPAATTQLRFATIEMPAGPVVAQH